ncbi:hypothetical protein C8T65DRAFT_744689 [Cerioporus squamosus]|nr:hypothetical protein C8T65DRAFT_744689 [Cerioporus squamosus]
MAYYSLLRASLAIDLWKKAWGKPWPHQSSGKISMADISPDEDVPRISIETEEDDDSIGPDGGHSTTSTELQYTCLHEMKAVVKACGGNARSVQDALVIRSEYVWLRETMETGYLRNVKAMVVTGHPGIGKTVFLLYLLLYRLERRLPTAIQL